MNETEPKTPELPAVAAGALRVIFQVDIWSADGKFLNYQGMFDQPGALVPKTYLLSLCKFGKLVESLLMDGLREELGAKLEALAEAVYPMQEKPPPQGMPEGWMDMGYSPKPPANSQQAKRDAELDASPPPMGAFPLRETIPEYQEMANNFLGANGYGHLRSPLGGESKLDAVPPKPSKPRKKPSVPPDDSVDAGLRTPPTPARMNQPPTGDPFDRPNWERPTNPAAPRPPAEAAIPPLAQAA